MGKETLFPYRVLLAWERFKLAVSESWMTPTKCDGGFSCQAQRHIHGCFSDFGNCDNPGEWHGSRRV